MSVKRLNTLISTQNMNLSQPRLFDNANNSHSITVQTATVSCIIVNSTTELSKSAQLGWEQEHVGSGRVPRKCMGEERGG